MLEACYILNASNQFLTVTNYQGISTLQTTRWLPLGTVGATATGELGLKVISLGGSGAGGTATIGFSPSSGVTSAAAPMGRTLLAGNTFAAISAAAGSLLFVSIVNRDTVTNYVKFYNAATAISASTPIWTLAIPSGTMIFVAGADVPAIFTTACCVRSTTESADNGTTSPATLPIIEYRYG